MATSVATSPFWWEDAPLRPPASAPEALPAEVDVLIVGAGLTGASAALTLARAGRSVLVCDAGAPGEGASSRNGGMIGGGHRLSVDDLVARFGRAMAVDLLREAHRDSLAYARDLMAQEAIACDFAETGRFRGFWHRSEAEATARELDKLRALVPVEADLVARDRQRDEVATDLYEGGVVFPRHGGLNPAKWVNGLLAAAERAGARIAGHSAVTGIEEAGAAGARVETARGPVRAGAVLLATNGYTPRGFGGLHRHIVPIPSYLIATEPLGANRVRALIPSGRMIVETRERHCYYRPSPDGSRIVFGGRAAMFEAPEGFVRAQMTALLVEVFPDLKGVGISHSWRGLTGFSFDHLPYVGRHRGLWIAMGYSGSGNAMAPWLGHKAALQILGDPAGATAFARTPFSTRWWHRGRPWFLPAADLLFRWRDARADRAKRAGR